LTQPDTKDRIEQLLSAALQARSAGEIGAAERIYRQIVGLDPAHHGALHNLGVIATITRRLPQAVEWFERAVDSRPGAADTHSNLGAVLKELGDVDRAASHLAEAIRLEPGHAAAHNNLGSVRLLANDPEAALQHFRRALELNPDDGVAWGNAGRALLASRGAAAAIEPLQRAVALAPQSMEMHLALGGALYVVGRFAEAKRALERALELRPGQMEVLADLVHMRQHVCDWAGLDEDAARIRDYVAAAPQCGVSPFYFMVLPGTTALEQRRCAEKYASALLAGTRGQGGRTRYTFSREPRRRLRIGYCTAHFSEDATTRLLIGVLERHDRERFEVVGLSCDRDTPREVDGRARAALDDFLDLRAMSDDAAARAIHGRGIDILVDGQGYNRGARPGILERRPAPVQAGYLVYPGTTGADFLDCLIADRFVVPPGQAAGYSERVKYLPDSYQCTDDRRVVPDPPTRAECGLPAEGLVFCNFNQLYKLTPDVFGIWCRLLGETPGSVLWLWASNAEAPRNLRREARARGVDAERLVFAPTLPADAHLARTAVADLYLDTYPCNGHTTASDALWAGVPALTCAGETFASRVAGSLLHAVGLPDMITTSLTEYEALALGLARDPAALSDVRRRLALNRATAPLFDTARTTRALEAVYEEMWREFLVTSDR
jgi:predicted O-linked N-acetylglucosamine transferase (SPINDLY family)